MNLEYLCCVSLCVHACKGEFINQQYCTCLDSYFQGLSCRLFESCFAVSITVACLNAFSKIRSVSARKLYCKQESLQLQTKWSYNMLSSGSPNANCSESLYELAYSLLVAKHNSLLVTNHLVCNDFHIYNEYLADLFFFVRNMSITE